MRSIRTRKLAQAEDIHDILNANFEYGKVEGLVEAPVKSLSGGVNLRDPKEKQRVLELRDRISAEGLKNPIVIDDKGNVIEGQHRLEALRLLGEGSVVAIKIVDLSNKYNIQAMLEAIGETMALHPEQQRGLVKEAINAMEEEGGKEEAISNRHMPEPYSDAFQAAVRAA